jgi:hypothetical protein
MPNDKPVTKISWWFLPVWFGVAFGAGYAAIMMIISWGLKYV